MESAVVVARPSRRLRSWLAGLVLLTAGVMAPVSTSTVAEAVTAEVGVINVTWQFTYTYGCIMCGGTFSGSSSGNISGVDATGTAYTVSWPGSLTNLTVNLGVTMVCQPVATGGAIVDSTFAISGAVLVYGRSTYNASVNGVFGGTIVGDTVVAAVGSVTITGGPSPISFPPLHSDGVLQMVPTTPVTASCLLGPTQGFAVSGPILTML